MEIANHSYAAMGEGKIMRLTGWFPEKIEQKVEGILGENNLTYLIEDPAPGDKVPVILHNQKYPRIFESITKIFQLPNYYEFDLTPMIAVFYPIFFGYCLGDAGYGVVLIILSVIGAFTFFKKARNVAALIFVLGLMTAVVGIIKSGTLFGIPIAERQDIPFFAELSKYILINDDQDYIFNAFNVALMIGVVQIIVAVITNIVKNIRYKGMVYALGGVGKLIIIVSTITLFLGSIQKMPIFIPLYRYGDGNAFGRYLSLFCCSTIPRYRCFAGWEAAYCRFILFLPAFWEMYCHISGFLHSVSLLQYSALW
jgi:V/A-type H+/Na+-transporting ATPase subunit I